MLFTVFQLGQHCLKTQFQRVISWIRPQKTVWIIKAHHTQKAFQFFYVKIVQFFFWQILITLIFITWVYAFLCKTYIEKFYVWMIAYLKILNHYRSNNGKSKSFLKKLKFIQQHEQWCHILVRYWRGEDSYFLSNYLTV